MGIGKADKGRGDDDRWLRERQRRAEYGAMLTLCCA